MGKKLTEQILADTVSRLTSSCSLRKLYHEHTDGRQLPSGNKLKKIIDLTREIIFPGYFGKSDINLKTLQYPIGSNIQRLHELLREQVGDEDIATTVIERLPEIQETLATDVEAAYNGDPAAENYGEIISCYPVIRVLTNYRLAHELYKLGVPLIPRILTEMAHSETGIDIHPGAQIGHHFTIDHGTGVVIGATCIIGNNVKLYQGVTLGAKSFPLDDNGNPIKGIPRHPILEDDVIVYSNATILGRITIGKGTVIGANVWVTQDVKAGESIVKRQKD